jgi:hypothetical protein
MKNRIASLFALDTLLGGTTNGHGPATHPPGHRAKQKASKARRGRKDKETQRGAKSVDKGDPIRCQHDVAYKPVAPVDVGTPPAQATTPTAVAHQLGDEYDVEAFEEPDEEDLTPRLADEDEYERLETASSTPWEEEPPTGPEEASEPVTVRAESYQKPRTFAAEMTAVEQDLAELAARATQPAPAAPTTESPAPGDSEAEPVPAPPTLKASGHAVFDQMAQGMGYATEFRLPPVSLTQVFSALDRQLDAEAARPVAAAPVAGPPPPVDAVAAVPPTETLIKDLVEMPGKPAEPESAPVTPG